MSSHFRSSHRAPPQGEKSGETLYSIATTYKTTVAALKRNNGNVAVLRPGMILIVQPSR